MAFYIKATTNTINYKEDGTQVLGLEDAKGYSTEAAAQAVIDKTDPFHWSFELKQQGKTLTVVEE